MKYSIRRRMVREEDLKPLFTGPDGVVADRIILRRGAVPGMYNSVEVWYGEDGDRIWNGRQWILPKPEIVVNRKEVSEPCTST